MKTFDELFFEAMSDAISDVFGGPASKLIFDFMREEIEEKIEVFVASLERLLGSEGAQIIQSIGLKRLFLGLQQEYCEVEKYVSILDELFEVKFRLLATGLKAGRSVCSWRGS